MLDRLGPYELGPGGEHEGIYTGDARLLSEAIPDESVDLIFTDPVYQNIDDYRWLAETAARVLRTNGVCLAWYGGKRLAAAIVAMTEGLEFAWILNYVVPAKTRFLHCGVFPWTTQCLYLRKNHGRPQRAIPDTFISHSRPSGQHKWNKNIGVIQYWLQAFMTADEIAFDPFTGGGTVPAACKMLGRRYLAFEILPDEAETARERVRMTQMPLFVLEHEQAEMTLGGDWWPGG